MSTTSTGRNAEEKVAKFLENQGQKIIALNWRTRWCEIDLITQRNKTVYFTEVKYRSSADWGGGLEYITPKKLKQMKFAAEFWIHDNSWKGLVVLQAAEVDNQSNINLIEI